MPAIKSGNNIHIEGLGNTLQSIADDINDISFCEITAIHPLTLTIKNNIPRVLDIRNEGELIIGNTEDYSEEETLEFEGIINSRARFNIQQRCSLKVYGKCTINFAKTARPYYSYIYGKIELHGTATHRVTFLHLLCLRIYSYFDRAEDTWYFDHVDILDSYNNPLYFMTQASPKPSVFRNILLSNVGTPNENLNYAIFMRYSDFFSPYLKFESCTFQGFLYPLSSNYNNIHLKDCIFNQSGTYKGGMFEGTNISPFIGGNYNENGLGKRLGQVFSLLEGNTYNDFSDVNTILCYHGSTILLKDNIFNQTSGNCITVQYSAVAMLWTGNVFNGVESYAIIIPGLINWVHALDLTVLDENDDPVEDAVIMIRQSQGKEYFSFRTKSNGKVETCHDLGVALLTHKSQYGNNPVTNAEYWSDDSNSTYHEVIIAKSGYLPTIEQYVMDQEIEDTITLQLPPEPTYIDRNIDASIKTNKLSGYINMLKLEGKV